MRALQSPVDNFDESRFFAFLSKRIESSMRHLNQIADPSARKIVIMSKRERGELTDKQTEQLIRFGGLAGS